MSDSGIKSGVALRLPPQSKTIRFFFRCRGVPAHSTIGNPISELETGRLVTSHKAGRKGIHFLKSFWNGRLRQLAFELMQPENVTVSDFLKCDCPNCGQSIEYPAEGTGQTVPCPTCENPFVLSPANPLTRSDSIEIPPAPVQERPKEKKTVRSNLSKLTEETIRAKTSAGNTPVHLAAKNRKIDLISSHLLSVDLFMDRNNDGNTPLHIAAMNGTLNQVPRQFLTKETLTIPQAPYYAPNGFHITGSGYKAQSPTVLHVAANNGHLDQIPKEFFTPEFLLIEATGYRETVLEYIVKSKRLDLLPENYASSELWNLKNSNGQTPREILEILIEREAQRQTWQAERESYVARVRNEPATEKQKEKLRCFGYVFDETITKGQASDALDKCVRDFPEVDRAYYSRPATEEQLTKLRAFYGKNLDEEVDGPLNYRKAKDLIWEREMYERKEKEEEFGREILIDIVARRDFWPGLTRGRVKKAAKVLDETQTEWRKDKNHIYILQNKVAELNPELAAREGWPTHGPDVSPEFLAEAIKALENHTKTSFHYPASSGYAVQGQNAPTETQIQKSQQNRPTEAQIKSLEGGLKLDPKADISASKLDELLKLEGQPPRAEDMELFARHGITLHTGDAFATYGLADLVRCFVNMVAEGGGHTNISMACMAASHDPALKKSTITIDQFNRLVFTWPKRKLKEWYRKGAEF